MHQNSRISMLKSENFLVRISKFSLRGYKTRQDTELPLKSQIFRSRLENTSKQRNRVQTQHRNAHPRLSKNSKTSSASLLKARNPSYFSVRKLQNTHPPDAKLTTTKKPAPGWGPFWHWTCSLKSVKLKIRQSISSLKSHIFAVVIQNPPKYGISWLNLKTFATRLENI